MDAIVSVIPWAMAGLCLVWGYLERCERLAERRVRQQWYESYTALCAELDREEIDYPVWK